MAIFQKKISRLIYAPLILCGVFFGAQVAEAASLYLSPTTISVSAGATFTQRVYVSSTDQAANAVQGTVSFPADLVQVVGVSKGGTFPLWVQEPSFSNGGGTVSFSAVVPTPGYQGGAGTVMSITFRAVRSGTGTIRFSSASVLANDGQGTEILSSSPGASITVNEKAAVPITEPKPATPKPTPKSDAPVKESSVGPLSLTSSTHPDQAVWYPSASIIVSWKNPAGVTQVRTGYDKDPEGKPEKVYTTPIRERAIDGDEGVTYFHLQVRDADGWGAVSTYRLNIDTGAPSVPVLRYTKGVPPLLAFTASDELSGLSGYEVRVNGGEAMQVSTTSAAYQLTKLPGGANTIEVAALDAAGNRATSTSAVIVTGGAANSWTEYLWSLLTFTSPLLLILLLLVVLAYGTWFLWNRFKSIRERAAYRADATNNSLKDQFADLRDALVDEEGALGQFASVHDLTVEEKRFFKRFTTQLEKAENVLEKKITHIPD